jgi:hypothetical protein
MALGLATTPTIVTQPFAQRLKWKLPLKSHRIPETFEVNGPGRDGFGAYTLKGSAKSLTEISLREELWMDE